MKYMKQFCVIVLVSFAGETLKVLLPFPVPASVYAMLVLFLALETGMIRLEQVQDVSMFLVEIMPVLFVSAGVGVMNSWGEMQHILLPVIAVISLTTVIVMAVAGRTTQAVKHWSERRKQIKHG